MKQIDHFNTWLGLLHPIIEEYKSGCEEPLNQEEAADLANIIHLKIQLNQGIISEDHYNHQLDTFPTNH